MAITLAQHTEASVWIKTIDKCGNDVQAILQVLDDFLGTELPCYEVLDRVYEKITLFDPSFETMALVWQKLSQNWRHFPDHGYGFFDTELDGEPDSIMDGTDAFLQLLNKLISEAAQNVTDFDSALEVFQKSHSVEAVKKIEEFASTPDHAMAWLALNENGNTTLYSQYTQAKLHGLATRDDVRLEMLRQGAFDPRILNDLRRQLAASTNPVTSTYSLVCSNTDI